jgi:hypothetical protein
MGIETAQCKCESGGPVSGQTRLTSSSATSAGRYLWLMRSRPRLDVAGGAVFPGNAVLSRSSLAGHGAGGRLRCLVPPALPIPCSAAPLRATPAFCRGGRFVTATATGACGSPRENDFNVEC